MDKFEFQEKTDYSPKIPVEKKLFRKEIKAPEDRGI
jgi:hypothetical protein